MGPKQSELSEEMYRRLYRLIKRNVDLRVIANTLNIPLRTVESIKSRFEKTSGNEFVPSQDNEETERDNSYLDIYTYPKTRYAILQIVGTLNAEHLAQFKDEIEKAYNTSFKALAIRMSDLTDIDQAAIDLIVQFHEKFQNYGKFLAILDPSEPVETKLIEMKIDKIIQVFGTERAFEDAAFLRKSTTATKRV